MLGEKIGEFRGKVTGTRVLPSETGAPKIEVSFDISGTMLGADATMMGTYWSCVRPDGTSYGECPKQGVIMTRDGGNGTWGGAGIGHFTGKGTAVSYRGGIYFQTAPKQLARLTSTALVYEWDVDENGGAKATFWEWK